ncbi:MAG: hypothetical protein GX851_05740, partial [Clostridiales bacterium]|nr:hypothetical protein [Clostridiales bacterium]
ISLTTYTITAAVFSSVGTSFEGVFFSGVLLFVPTIFFTCLQFLMSKFVYGNPYGEIFAYMGTRSYMQDSEMLSTRFEFLSPILHNITELSNYGAYDPKFEINPAMTMSQGVPYTAPNYLPAIIWLIFSAAVFFVGMFIFQKRKAEICGFIGMNKYLNSVVPFLLGFFAFTVCLYKLPLSILVCGIIGIVLYFIIYCAIDLALKRNLKAFLKGMIKFPVHAAVTLIITAIFATGLFGFSSRLPDLKDIQSADIAPVGNTELFAGAGNYFGSSSSVNYASFGGLIADYVSESDIKAILELHKKLIDGGIIEETKNGEYIADDSQRNIPSTVQFVYKLKNGKTFMRDYNVVNAQTLTDMLQIDVLERTKEKLVQAFDKAEYEKITKQIKKENHNPYMTYDYRLYEKLVNLYATNINLKLFTADGTTAVGLNISYEERIQLIEALKKDLLEQTVEERYFPTAPALFTLNFLAQAGDDDAMTEKYGGTASIIDPSATSPEASEAEEPEAPPEKIAPETNLQTVSPDNVAGNLYTITADMTNTIELIKALGAEEYTVT